MAGDFLLGKVTHEESIVRNVAGVREKGFALQAGEISCTFMPDISSTLILR